MIALSLQDSFAPVSQNDLDEFERRAGLVLPSDHRSLLLRSNGGSYSEAAIIRQAPDEEISFDGMFGINTHYDFSDIEFYLADSSYRRHQLLPIGSDPGGNLFMYALKGGKRKPGIYFWDHERDRIESRMIAESIPALLGSIVMEPSREADIRAMGRAIAAAALGELGTIAPELLPELERECRQGDDWTLLMASCAFRCVKSVEYLLKEGCDINATNLKGQQALHLAARGGSPDCCKALLTAGADPNCRDSQGLSPLHYAIGRSQLLTAESLLERNADPTIIDHAGRSIGHAVAETGDRKGFAELFERYGVKV